MKRALLALLAATSVSACASNHDLKKGNNSLAGGFESDEVMPGLHYILARTNFAPWKNFSAARKSWK